MSDLLAAALDYAGRGWSIIPVRGKVAAVKWERFQARCPSEAELRSFAWGKATGLAVILGPVSGSLACRDFDLADAYQAWAKAHPAEAKNLPTVRTARGFHVYFAGAAGVRTAHLDDGELRSAGSYCLVPPSHHPDGPTYEWVVPLPKGDVPAVDPAAAGLGEMLHRSTPEYTVTPSLRHSVTPAVEGSADCAAEIAAAVESVLPYREHQNHSQLFTLARALKTLERKRGAKMTTEDFQKAIELYHGRAQERGFLRPGFTKEDYLQELLDGFQSAKYGLGECNKITEAWEAAKMAVPPARAENLSPDFRQLVCFVRELQGRAGQEPFFLSVRQLQAIGGMESAMQANRRLRWLVREGYLREITKGSVKNRLASTFRFVPTENP